MANTRQAPVVAGVYAALATPMRAQSTEADAAALLEYADAVVRTGVDGLVLFGSTGEFVHFDIGERMRVVTLAIRRSRVPVLVNVSHSSLAGAVDLAQHAVGAGARGLLLMPPYLYRYTAHQIVHFYEQFRKLLGGGPAVYLYNPLFADNRIPLPVAEQLLASGAFSGIKDSSGDWNYFEALYRLRARHPFTLLTGAESLFLRSRLAGADGLVSGIAAAVPELLVAIDRAIRASDINHAHHLDFLLQALVERARRFPIAVPIKQTALLRGWKLNQFAVPLDDDSAADLIVFLEWARSWLPAVLSECTPEAAHKR